MEKLLHLPTSVLVFIIAIFVNAWLLEIYIEERHSGCGGAVPALSILSFIVLFAMGGCAVAGYHLISKSSFVSSWWRFTRNVTLVLCLVTTFVIWAEL